MSNFDLVQKWYGVNTKRGGVVVPERRDEIAGVVRVILTTLWVVSVVELVKIIIINS